MANLWNSFNSFNLKVEEELFWRIKIFYFFLLFLYHFLQLRYPTFTIIGKLFTYLPGFNPAWKVNLSSAIFGATATLFIHLAALDWTNGHHPAAFLSAGIFAFNPLLWEYHTSAEVFALNNLFAAWIVWLIVKYGLVRWNCLYFIFINLWNTHPKKSRNKSFLIPGLSCQKMFRPLCGVRLYAVWVSQINIQLYSMLSQLLWVLFSIFVVNCWAKSTRLLSFVFLLLLLLHLFLL